MHDSFDRNLHRVLAATLIIACFALPVGIDDAQAKGNDTCSAAVSPGARLLCSSVGWKTNLARADLERTLEVLKPYLTGRQQTDLKREQRQWTVRVLGPCTSIGCLNNAYIGRADALGERLNAARRPRERTLSERETRSTCAALAKLADEGALGYLAEPGRRQLTYEQGQPETPRSPWHTNEAEKELFRQRLVGIRPEPEFVYRLRLSSTASPTRFGSFFGEGTCVATTLFNVPRLLDGDDTGGRRLVDNSDDVRLWPYWGGGDYPIFYRGRYFVVTAAWGDANDARMISSIQADGEIVPMCLLAEDVRRPEPVKPGAADVCAAVGSGTLKPASWSDVPEAPTSDGIDIGRPAFDKLFGTYGGPGEILKIDLPNVGHPVTLARFGEDSGAGCGSSRQWISVVPTDASELENNPLDDVFAKLRFGIPDIFTYKGVNYLRASDSAAADQLVALHGTKIEPVCLWKRRTKVERLIRPVPEGSPDASANP